MTIKQKLATMLASGALALSLAGAPAHAADAPQVLTNGTFSGTLAPSSGGSFAEFALPYASDESEVVLTFHYGPVGDEVAADAVALKLYRQGKLFDTAQPFSFRELEKDGQGAQATPGLERLVLKTDEPGPYTVQISSYLPTQAITWSLDVSGLAQAPTTSSMTAQAEPVQAARALAVAGAGSAAPASAPALVTSGSGVLVGTSGGSFAWYRIDYPVADEYQEYIVDLGKMDPIIARGVKIELFKGNQVHATGEQIRYGDQDSVDAEDDGVGQPGHFRVVLSDDEAGTYYLRISNYIPGAAVPYTVRAVN